MSRYMFVLLLLVVFIVGIVVLVSLNDPNGDTALGEKINDAEEALKELDEDLDEVLPTPIGQ
jgi:hypothetical protein